MNDSLSPLSTRWAWFTAGESRLLGLLDDGPDLRAPSLLPGWSRAHLVAHLIGNADALGRLVHWARTGEPTPMYADADARATQIESDAQRDDARLVDELGASSERLEAAMAVMSPTDWKAPVRTAMGREVAAVEIPWMRVRESAIHALDLDVGAGLGGCPPALVDALLTDAAVTVGSREGCPSLVVAPRDRGRTWSLGPGDAPSVVTGSAVELLTWVVGRPTVTDLPELPRWL